jgi:Zn-dependent alcohol dehydrogenase
MRAAVLETQGSPLVLWDDVDIAAPRAGQVLVRVEHCGVCHSDLSIVDGMFPSPTPILLGHEAAGVVDAIGPDVEGLAVGDHVVLTPVPPCGTCYFCLRGEPGVCVNAASIVTNSFRDGSTGLSRRGGVVFRGVGVGAFGEYVVTAATGAVKIPDEVSLEVACVIGCAVQTGVGAVLNTARVEPGATVLVFGLGGIGLSIVQGARVAGASRIIAADPVAARREAGLRMGATDVLDPSTTDVVARAQQITGVGVDYAFDAVGRARLVEDGNARDAKRRHHRRRRRGADRRGDHDRARRAVHHQREEAPRLHARQLQLDARDPAPDRPLAGWSARPREPGHGAPAARRDQPRPRRSAREPRRPHRARDAIVSAA